MRFNGRPWTGKRFVLEYARYLLSLDITDDTRESIMQTLNAYNRRLMSTIETMHAIDSIIHAH